MIIYIYIKKNYKGCHFSLPLHSEICRSGPAIWLWSDSLVGQASWWPWAGWWPRAAPKRKMSNLKSSRPIFDLSLWSGPGLLLWQFKWLEWSVWECSPDEAVFCFRMATSGLSTLKELNMWLPPSASFLCIPFWAATRKWGIPDHCLCISRCHNP